ncbi:DNA replication/repair protein RecF [bacterium]|nr:DNA replication/repair protein RecF [candidate division CSSED10-310 bacterium]
MIIQSIRTAGFRNLTSHRIELSPQVNAFIGLNAQGKSNLLEAVSVLSDGRSFRGARLPDMICYNGMESAVEGVVCSGNEEDSLKVHLNRTQRRFFVNDVRVSDLRGFLGKLSYVVFSSETMAVIDGEPRARRDFMDHGCFSIRPLFLLSLRNYKRVLKSRNVTLKTDTRNRNLISTWDPSLCRFAVSIALARRQYLNSISVEAARIHSELTGGRESLETVYLTEWFNIDHPLVDQSEYLETCLKDCLEKDIDLDIRRGCTMSGPHRDDMMIRINGKDARMFGSRGQKRTAVLALKLAEISVFHHTVNEYPVLLLDDIASEFDDKRQKELLRSIPEKIQVIISHTGRLNGFFLTVPRYFNVTDGLTTPCPQ